MAGALPVATWLDLVIGVDYHIVLIPTPGGPPVPTRIPHPFMGLCGDPVGYALSAALYPLISLIMEGKFRAPPGPVLANGRPRMTIGSSSSNMLLMPHIPLGGPFAKPPSGRGAHHVGSKSVLAGGSPTVRHGEVVFTCSDPMALPSSLVLVTPKGAPVVAGGPVGVDLKQEVRSWVTGRLIRGVFKSASLVARLLGRLCLPRLRTIAPRAQITCKGDPVDVASGAVVKDATDVSLAGPIPLTFKRSYSSAWSARRTDLGYGWSHSFDRCLWVEDDGIVCRTDDGREIVFDPDDFLPEGSPGVSSFDPVTGYTLSRTGPASWTLERPDGLVERYCQLPDEPAEVKPARLQLARCLEIRSRDGHHGVALTWIAGRLRSVRTNRGMEARFEHDPQGRLRSILLPDPDVSGSWRVHSVFSYSSAGDLEGARDALGFSTQYKYRAHLLVQEIWKNGVQFCWGYDGLSSQARCIRTWGYGTEEEPLGDDGRPLPIFNLRFMYDSLNRKTWVWDSDGHVTEHHASELGLVTFIREPGGGITRRTYDGFNLTSETNALGQVHTWTHDDRGRLVATTAPDGGTTETRYEGLFADLPTYHRDVRGAEWRTTYDRNGNRTAVAGPEGFALAWRWADGFLQRIEPYGRAPTSITYFDSGLPKAVIPEGAAAEVFQYDLRNQLVIEERRDLQTGLAQGRRTFQRDFVGRVVRVAEPDGNVRNLSYDGEGNLLTMSDQAGITTCTYRGADWLSSRDENGAVVAFDYTAEGELLELRNELGRPHRFVHDKNGRVVEEHGFDVRTFIRYERDAAGQITKVSTHLRKGQLVAATEHELDVMGRVVARKLPDGTIEQFAYNSAGDLLSATNATTRVTFDRDLAGRVIREHQGENTVSYQYAPSGAFTGLRSSLGAQQVVDRDAFGAPERIYLGDGPAGHVDLEHDVFGRETRRQLPNGVASTWTWDAAGRPTSLTVGQAAQRAPQLAGGDNFASRDLAPAQGGWRRDYLWRPEDRLDSMLDSRFGKSTFRHDNRGRIFSETDETGTQYRVSDAVGNVYRSPDKSDRVYTFGGMLRQIRDPQLTGGEIDPKGPATDFAYDYLGRCTRRQHNRTGGGWAYEWDGAGNLAKAMPLDAAGTPIEAGEVEFQYDALGRRVAKRSAEKEVRWLWSGNQILHERRGGTGGSSAPEPLVTWYHEPDGLAPLAQIVGEGHAHPRFDVIADHLGTPTAMYDEAGAIVWHMQLDLFGVPRREISGEQSKGGTKSCNWRWPGQSVDRETGLYYNRFRYYDPAAGAYLSKDPIGVDGGLALYSYVNDPLLGCDPFGLIDIVRYSIRDWLKIAEGDRKTAIDRAWREERNLLREAGEGTRAWTPEEGAQLLKTGKVVGYTGHHINNVARFPRWKGDPRNIVFLTNSPSGGDHLNSAQGHRGDFENPTKGRLIDRRATLGMCKKG